MPDFLALQELTAAGLNAALGTWTNGTPTLTAATTNPTNYTATSRWEQNGKLGIMLFQVTAGASFTPGTGNYSISLPVTAVLNGPTAGMVRLFDSSSGNAHLGARVALNSATALGMQVTTTFGGSLVNVAHNVPWTWAVGDIMDGFVIFEVA